MLTLTQLLQGTKKLRSKIVYPAVKEIRITKRILNRTKQTYRVAASVKGTSEPKTHVPMIQFNGLSISDKKDAKHTKRFRTKSGTYIWLARPTRARTKVEVRCTCSDYRFTYWIWNKKAGSHLGKDFPTYERKTDTYPERNALHTPGACKHILGLAKVLNLDEFLL